MPVKGFALLCAAAWAAATASAAPALGPSLGGFALPEPPALPAAGPARRARPADDPEQAAQAEVRRALAVLARAESGRELAAQVGSGPPRSGRGTRILYDPTGSLLYIDGEDAVYIGPDFLGLPDWQLAVMLSHELEHARQNRIGLNRSGDMAARELGAFLAQCRVWVELGGQAREEDWAANGKNSWDMAAWVERPWSALAALAVRTDRTLELSRPEIAAYWRELQEEERAWRRRWEGRLPRQRDSRGAALAVLRQAGRFADQPGAGEISDWLPEALEAAAGLAPGGRAPLAGPPSEKDRRALAVLPFPVEAVEEGGRWALHRPAI